MSSKQASPLTGALILAGFIAIGMTVMLTVRATLQSQEHDAHAGHSAWADTHSVAHAVAAAVDQPHIVRTSYDTVPRPGAKVRTLREFYSRRAYPGAPPFIPHDVGADGLINDSCLSCHKDGGFVPEYNAYTPVTPHPEMQNCRQCHVPRTVEGTFVESNWDESDLPKRGRQAIPGGPLQIPHSLHMRNNCLACHGGPQAVVEIRTSHPERQNCVQCHVPDRGINSFKSKIDTRMESSDVKK